VNKQIQMALAVTWLFSAIGIPVDGADWLRFRGPDGSGVALDKNLPVEWSEENNVAWKAELPGRGISSPIVIGDRVVLTSCSGYRQDRLHVLCFAAASGKKLWQRQFWATGRTMCHAKTTTAAPTPSSDGRRIFAHFSTNDMACLDLEGNLLWLRGLLLQYPNASGSLGLASSPVVVGETLVTQIETDSQSVALGLDAATGETRWEVNRPQSNNWSSPITIRDDEGTDFVVMQAGDGLKAYDPTNGELVWHFPEPCGKTASSGLAGNVIFVPCQGLTALRFNTSDTEPELLWQEDRLSPSSPSPLTYGGKVYLLSGSILKCADAETGEMEWQLRLQGNFTSSPVGGGGRVYCFNEEGMGQVVEPGVNGSIAASNTLDEGLVSSPAIANGALYVRSYNHLWKIAEK